MSLQNPLSEDLSAENRRLAQAIDHTRLTFAPGEDEERAIETLCREALAYGFYAVCVRPRHVAQAKRLLAGSPVRVATVIGFPAQKVKLADELCMPTIGQFSTVEKQVETRQAVDAGADELDLVINVAALKQDVQSGTQTVRQELLAIAEAAAGRLIKVIIETDLLTPAEMVQITQWCAETDMGMVKTSTGMVEGGHGATLEGVRLIARTLRQTEPETATGIKASGGIKSRAQALAFLELGVNRLGTSSGVAIVGGDDSSAAMGTY